MTQATAPTLVFRVDGSPQMGTGHVMRCLALAQGWRDVGGAVRFVMARGADVLGGRLRAEGIDVAGLGEEPATRADATTTAEIVASSGASWLVLDGYSFDGAYQGVVKEADLRLLCIDDTAHADRYWADAVLNQNIYADERMYATREPDTRLLLGTRYALLRREFTGRTVAARTIPDRARRLLVTLGGSDADNVTETVIRGLSDIGEAESQAVVLVGAANPHAAALEDMVRGAGNVRLKPDVPDVAAEMARADLVVSAAGTTCWELAFMGLPAVLIVLAENQRRIAEGLAQAGVAVNLGESASVGPGDVADAVRALIPDRERRGAMSARGRELVDGRGVRLVVDFLRFEGR
jgi:UDP-2,4-diacetamido-2,4,6-trideoxy-beta-L-altropyranose hydrolase